MINEVEWKISWPQIWDQVREGQLTLPQVKMLLQLRKEWRSEQPVHPLLMKQYLDMVNQFNQDRNKGDGTEEDE